MGQVTVKKENNAYCIKNILAASENYNKEEAMKLFDGLSDIFLPVMVCKEEKSLQCIAKGLIPLSEYQQRVIDKQSFMEMIVQMVMMIRIGEQNGLIVNNIDLDYDRVFLEPESLKVYFIYWPITKPITRNSLEVFFSNMAFDTIFSRSENNSYVSQYISFFKKGEMFSLANFEKMIMLLANDGKEREGNIPEKSYQVQSEVNSGETSVLDPVLWENMMGNLKAVANNDTCVLTPDLLNFNNPAAVIVENKKKQEPPYLIRESHGERVSIIKTEFVIGKDRSVADYTIDNNSTISRKHASILTKGTRYYIVDYNSTNSTYVNDIKILSETETEIFSGTQIRLSDEKFTFYIN